MERKVNIGSKKTIPNLDLVKKVYTVFKSLENVHFHYIAAHTGLNDIHSMGNEGADRLANLAIGVSECLIYKNQKSKPIQKIYINLPYDEKEEGKKLGTRWDPKKKNGIFYQIWKKIKRK